MWRFLQIENDFEIIPFDERQVHEALAAFAHYGKGIDPNARLNLSDCAAYALAKTLNAPLLFEGNDFVQTDLKSAL
jgi:ribonuclease VapC